MEPSVIENMAIISESLDQFYEIATWVVGIIGFLLAVVLFYVVLILRDMSYVSKKARETSDTVNEYIRKPAGMIMRVASSMEGIADIALSQIGKLMSSKKKRTRARKVAEEVEDYED